MPIFGIQGYFSLGSPRNRIRDEDWCVGGLLGSTLEMDTYRREGKKEGGKKKLGSDAASLETSADREKVS